MRPDLYWVAVPRGRLAIMARPRAGDWLADEMAGLRAAGCDTIVSLLEAAEVRELGLQDEAAIGTGLGMDMLALAVPDRGVPPDLAATRRLVDTLVQRLAGGASVAIHCRAGIGRSSLLAACVMQQLGLAAPFAALAAARGVAVPDTPAQVTWLGQFGRYAS